MYTEKFSTKLGCKKHPKYNPVRGQEAIKGGCTQCWDLHNLFYKVQTLKREISDFRQNYELGES